MPRSNPFGMMIKATPLSNDHIVIVDRDGQEHIFPPGFDPKQAAAMVRQGYKFTGPAGATPRKDPMLPRESKIGRDGAQMPDREEPARLGGPVTTFIDRHFKHFNAQVVREAGDGYVDLMDRNGAMVISIAGAMSTGELGISLAEMIRQKKVAAISCTAANCEESAFDLVAHNEYVQIPEYRDTTPADDQQLGEHGLNRVTDVALPEHGGMDIIEEGIIDLWKKAERQHARYFWHEYFYQLLLSDALKEHYQIDPKDCWLLAAAEAKLPLYVPGAEDSTLGNVLAALMLKGEIHNPSLVKSGFDYMVHLAQWYTRTAADRPMGFFQIGGGLAGDFAICVVPLLKLDYGREHTPAWSYFCQISDALESYGGYSGASDREKQSWRKLNVDTKRYMIQSDASICAPLIFARVLGW